MAKEKDNPSVVKSLLPGAVGGAVGTLATMPIDVTKDTMKTYRTLGTTNQQAISHSFFRTAKDIYKQHGPKGFFMGTQGSMIKIVPAMALTFAAGDFVKHKLEKKAEQKSSFLDKVKKAILPAAAGIGIYTLARHGKFNKTVAQKMSKGKFTILTENHSGIGEKLLSRTSQGARTMSLSEAAKSKKPITGSIYIDADQTSLQQKKIPFSSKAVVYNRAPKVIEGIFQDKLRFGQLKSPHIAKTWTIKQHVGKAAATPEEFSKQLASMKGDFYYKPRNDFGSGGLNHVSSKELRDFAAANKVHPVAKKIHSNPDAYIAQEKLNLEISRKQPRTEYRSHVMVQPTGKVTAVGPAVKRWWGKGEGFIDPFTKKRGVNPKQVQRAIAGLIHKNPSLNKAVAGKRLILGADVARDTRGKLKIIEINDQSGFLTRPSVARKVYKEITGKETPLASTVKGSIAAGAVMAEQKLVEKKAEYDLERKIFDRLPHVGKALFDKALLGRIGDKKVSGEEKDIAKHVPYNKKHQYLIERAITNPLVAGAGMAGFAALFHKYHAPMLRKAYSSYKKLENKKDPLAKAIRNALAGQLKDPDTGTMMKSVKRINEVAIKSPAEVRKSVALSAAVTGGATALGRYLHPRALKSEAILDKELYQQRNPTAYIHTKLRDDVELKRGRGIIKAADKKKPLNEYIAGFAAFSGAKPPTRFALMFLSRSLRKDINRSEGTHHKLTPEAFIDKINKEENLQLGEFKIPKVFAKRKAAIDMKLKELPGVFSPVTHTLHAKGPIVAAHELGHAKQYARWSRLTGSTAPAIAVALGSKFMPILTATLLLKPVTKKLKGKEEGSRRYKAVDTLERHPELVGASMVTPTLAREAGASIRGVNYLRRVGIKGGPKLLTKAFGTYVLRTIPIMAATAMMGSVRRKHMEKTALSPKLLEHAKEVARIKAVAEQLKPIRNQALIDKRLQQIRVFGKAAIEGK